ncbi:hypothetical protein PVAND_003034 [Polypedilum vanderplanki]|uniref:SOCS box domain-containing protein n=1 Tax=Polypedilum vanderplanki TaxID=319348 RepID=A0A9J6BTX4_POLVA|nr:hypothetical protein PVAND_003034 [Polypedilum vanderplanki]
MHLHFEKNSNTKCDCTILSLSWMGKVPEDIPEEEGWKLNRTNYYQEGWLATGNTRGIVGVTFSTSHCKKIVEFPQRTNYNLRGHRSDVILVKWNEPYQKLASCDSSGIIFVWIKYEGRWSVELINDRNTPVTHFSWSHDGRMALITYQDGFVLVGSVAGQRYWSSMLNLDATITCGLWTPDDQQVYFGTTQGQIIVMDVHGAMVSQVQLSSEFGITSMAWSCEKFKMEEGDSEPGVKNAANRSFVLAVSFQNGSIYLLKSFDDLSPAYINTQLCEGFCMEWSNSRELLAVAGTENDGKFYKKEITGTHYNNFLKFYTETGQILYTAKIPNTNSPVTALTWGHNDRRIFIATGNQVHIAWISRRVASLQLICRLKIQQSLASEALLPRLPLPGRMKSLIGNLFAQTIRCCVPNTKSLRDFVSRPPACSTRLHCTMIRHDDENQSSGTCYTLYLEFLGGLVPILKGKRTSKIRPEFVIFDPQVEEVANSLSSCSSDSTNTNKSLSSSSQSTSGSCGRNGNTDTSESESDDLCRSPRMQRKRKTRTKKRATMEKSVTQNPTTDMNEQNADDLAYVDTLPEHMKLVEVTSNIWGTKFKIHGIAKSILPANLGQVTYKTSLLHLQPRQMTLVITELRDDFPIGPDPSFNPNIFSEDEDDCNLKSPKVNKKNTKEPPNSSISYNLNASSSTSSASSSSSHPPIAPMSPQPNRFSSSSNNRNTRRPSPLAVNNNGNKNLQSAAVANTSTATTNPPRSLGPLAKAESYEDDLIETPVAPVKQGISYSNLISSYGRSSSSSSSTNQSRVAISPLYCEQSVPTLQSPKNAVAPSDIIFERPPAQTTLMSYSSNTDYSNSVVVQVKNALINDHNRQNSHVNPVPLNLNLNLERIIDGKLKGAIKKKDIQYIDDEPTPSTSTQTPDIIPSTSTQMNRTQTIASICPTIPDVITRSCSVGYLDNVELTPGEVTLSQLRKDAPKRLVLVDRKIQQNRKYRKASNQNRRNINQLKNKNFKKSISLDSCDALQDIPNLHKDLNNLFNQMPKLAESSEDTEFSSTEISVTAAAALKSKSKLNSTPKKSPKEKFCSFFSSRSGTPILGRKFNNKNKECSCLNASCLKCSENSNTLTAKPPLIPKWNKKQNSDNGECSKTPREQKRRNLEIITSFTDSPLFSRKYRASKNEFAASSATSTNTSINGSTGNRSQLLSENNTPIMTRKNENRSSSSSDSGGQAAAIEVTPVESKTSVSLHTQAMTTLENIISRLRDLDDDRSNANAMTATTSSSQQQQPSSPRHPRSSPSSPAPNKKNKRQQSSSPIRHILNSPLLNRRKCKKQTFESSDEDGNEDGDNNGTSSSSNTKSGYHDLETFQKAQLRQKLKRGKIEPNGIAASSSHNTPVRREFVMYNKAPMWNENSQVYQLDFGGRVTQESAKNFQIEFRGKQVMQFGRIDSNAYTLDYQYPFSSIQAFSVALANVTQRLK